MKLTFPFNASAVRRCLGMGLASLVLFLAGLALGRVTLPAPGPTSRSAGEPVPVADGAPSRYREATVYLPLDDNDGKPFDEKEWNEALQGLVKQFGGATLGQPQEGYWLDASHRLRLERVRPVIVGFPPHRLGEFRSHLHDLGRRLGQEALYVRLGEPNVELLPIAAAGACGTH